MIDFLFGLFCGFLISVVTLLVPCFELGLNKGQCAHVSEWREDNGDNTVTIHKCEARHGV